MAQLSQNELPQIDSYAGARRATAQWLQWVLVIGSFAVLLLAIAAPLWMPGMLRRIVPDRYIAAYAPEQLQEVLFDNNAEQILPTAQPVEPDQADALLGALGETPAPTPNAEPTAGVIAIPSETEQPPAAEEPSEGDQAGFVAAGAAGSVDRGPVPSSHQLSGFEHTYQGWNNCGPATLTTAISYFDLGVTQNDVAGYTKPNPEDRNVRPDELQAYVESLGYQMAVRVNGDLALLKALISAGYPVVIEKGFDPEPDRLGWMGHYLLLTGYDDATQTFTTMDSYLGPDRREPYDVVDHFWRHFNRTYLVAYAPHQAEEVAAIIGPDMDDATMWSRALDRAQAETQQNPADPFGWFNVGSALVALGDFENAATAFDLARENGTPWRMLWYQYGPYEAYLNVGGNRLYDVTTLADTVIYDNVYSEEAYYYKGLAYLRMGEPRAARNQFNKALQYNENYRAAREALTALDDV